MIRNIFLENKKKSMYLCVENSIGILNFLKLIFKVIWWISSKNELTAIHAIQKLFYEEFYLVFIFNTMLVLYVI